MQGWARRGLAIASASWVLAGAGCGEPPSPASTDTEGEASSSSGPGLDGTGTDTEVDPAVCAPGETRACYEGPPGTEGLGICAAGQQACAADGRGFTECVGQVWPEPGERCDTPQDDDCDGLTLCEPALEWSQTLPGYVLHVAALPDGGAVVVGADAVGKLEEAPLEGFFVAVLDAEGTLRWGRSTGFRSYAWPGALAVDASGAIVVGGWYDGAVDLGGGPLPPSSGYGAFAVRYDAVDGEHVWSHALESEGYFAAALGADGTTYLAGGYLYGAVEPDLAGAQIHVVALARDGSIAWILPGHGSWSTDPISLFTGAPGELVLVATAGGANVELGDLSLDAAPGYEPIAVRLGVDGTPLAHRRLLDPGVAVSAYDVRAFGRPGGALAVVTATLLQEDGRYETGGLVVPLDEALAPVSQRFLGNGTWLRALAPHPDGSTLLTLDFSGVLELGPIGVGIGGPAIAAVDDQAQGRWAEVLRSAAGHDLVGAVATPDGAVLVGGHVFEGVGTLAGAEVSGAFVAKLRP